MAKNLDDYRCKLISKILQAPTTDHVSRFFNAAIKSLKEHKVNGYVTKRFLDKIELELDSIQPNELNHQQLRNREKAYQLTAACKTLLFPTASVPLIA
ncbi:hypothetical protein [Flavihumibacter sp. CACIAM 22H1]|uniref:hypothetical protein n=1 Tax=Flavihumibacter sp. CACIAM 22H1 TaxID=1812911 RepID=UPI0007A8C124|nr:hypothetical protein [Flavihumibacter sp. CACIAM 22H1]KYP14508.1 MAG: hypothetical protein A1D16_15385 [Flavihumibacter sp. CACIAM 22H1]